MTARQVVVDTLAPLVPAGVDVLPYARNIEVVATAGTVMVRVDEVRPSTQPQCLREYRVALLLVVPQTTTGEDDLDTLLEDVLDTLETTPTGIVWESATRATFEDKFPAYELNTVVHFKKE